MSKRIGIIINDTFIGFHLFSLSDQDFLAISLSLTYSPDRFTMGGILVLYGIEFEIDSSLGDEDEE